MKKTVLVGMLLSIAFVAIHAQTTVAEFRKMDAVQKTRLVTDSLELALGLTKEQYPKVYATVLEGVKKAMQIGQSDASKFNKARKLRSILSKQEPSLKTMLSKEQFKLYETKKSQLIDYYRSHLDAEKLVFNIPG